MSEIDQRIQRLEERIAYLSADLAMLRTLVGRDDQSALNKIRYVTEKILHRLCKNHDVTWGKGEPTLERMIGPLTAREVIPKNVVIHVRTIQTNASPGSHYQENSLSYTHVHVAQVALLEFVEWYYRQEEHGELPPLPLLAAPSQPMAGAPVQAPPPPVGKSRAGFIAAGLLGGVLLVVATYAVLLLGRDPEARSGVVLGVELGGEDIPLARWALERHLSPVAEAVVADATGSRETWLLDGKLDEDGEFSWVGVRDPDGSLPDEERGAALSAARGQLIALPPVPWSGGLTLRIGTALEGAESWADITGAVPLDGAPLPAVDGWSDRNRQELAEALLSELPPAYFHGQYRLRAEFAMRASGTGGWESVETVSIRPEAYSTRAGNLLGGQLGVAVDGWDPSTLPPPPPSLEGRYVKLAVLTVGNHVIPVSPLPQQPTAFENLIVSPPRLSIDPSDVFLPYTAASASDTTKFIRALDGSLADLEACDAGLLAGTGLLRATTLAHVRLWPNKLDIRLTPFHNDVGTYVTGWESEGGEEQRVIAEQAVIDCIEAEIRQLDLPDVHRLAVAEIKLTVGPPLPHVEAGKSLSEEEAAQVVLARFLPRHLEQIACMEAYNKAATNTPDEPLTPWYAEVDCSGKLSEFSRHFSSPPTQGELDCTWPLLEGLRLPATGRDVVLDPYGAGPGNDRDDAVADEAMSAPDPTTQPDEAQDTQEPSAEHPAGGRLEINYGDQGDVGAVKIYVRKKKPEIKACYEQLLKLDPGFAGKVEVTFTVLPSGRIDSISVASNSTGQTWMEDCIASKIVSWRFPASEDEFEITYPFNFFSS